ncbi:MAG: hypothetical protein IJV95_03385 [Clostridia bacterium]|nr:hypothetical protein [Clostridia bacterium]
MLTIQISEFKYLAVESWQLYLTIGLTLAVVLAFYALRSIGLYVLAKRQNVKHAFLAWIPCVWMFTACKLIGNIKTFGRPFAKLALIFCIVFSVAEVLTIVYEILVYFPLVGNYLAGREICYAPYITADDVEFLANYSEYATNSDIYVTSEFVNPYGVGIITVNKILSVISIVSMIFDLASTVIVIMVYINLFRKFWPQHYVLAAILSIFGLFAPFVFAIRKKEPINYMDYIRSRYNYNPYANPYGPQGGPYGGNPYGNPYGAPKAPEHPFEEFADKGEVNPGDPFSEFSAKNNDDPFSDFDKK